MNEWIRSRAEEIIADRLGDRPLDREDFSLAAELLRPAALEQAEREYYMGVRI